MNNLVLEKSLNETEHRLFLFLLKENKKITVIRINEKAKIGVTPEAYNRVLIQLHTKHKLIVREKDYGCGTSGKAPFLYYVPENIKKDYYRLHVNIK